MKSLLLAIAFLVALLAVALLFNTLRFQSRQLPAAAIQPIDVDERSIAERLSQALRFRTVALEENGPANGVEFQSLHAYLSQAYARVHHTLAREVVGDYSLLYSWKGQDDRLKPVLLAAHQDVVPVEADVRWQHPPFEGRIADGYIWGRGAMDDKSSLMGILEAVEILLRQGFQPRRTIYLAFGHDEEVGGYEGAARIAAQLRARNVALEYVLDEGLIIADGILPVPRPVALIGIAEKGYVSLELSVDGEGGHSSTPPPHTAIGILSAAISRIEEHQMPGGLKGAVRQLFDYVGPEMPFGRKLVFANLWLFKPLVERQLSSLPAMNAGLRTTTAVTVIEGGVRDNVLPTSARAVVNFRILPGDSIEGVEAHVRDTVNDTRVKIARHGAPASEPSAVSSTRYSGLRGSSANRPAGLSGRGGRAGACDRRDGRKALRGPDRQRLSISPAATSPGRRGEVPRNRRADLRRELCAEREVLLSVDSKLNRVVDGRLCPS